MDTTPRDPQEWLTVEEIAAEVKVNPETVRRWIRTKRLAACLPNSDRGGYRVRRAELERFMVPTVPAR